MIRMLLRVLLLVTGPIVSVWLGFSTFRILTWEYPHECEKRFSCVDRGGSWDNVNNKCWTFDDDERGGQP